MKPPTCLTVVLVWCLSLSVHVKAHADVDPGMIGTWETSGVNEHGPWKLTWEIHADSSYVLSGALSDSGIIGSGDGRWHTRSNITKQSADGTYNLRDANHMEGTGPAGSGVWTRVGDARAGATPAKPSEWNPFANVFPEENRGAATLTDLSRELAYDYRNALFKKDEASRNRLEKKAQSGMAEAQVLFGMLLQREKNPAEAVGWYRKAAQQGNIDGMRGLGSCYRDGEGVSDDAAEAMKWYRKASDQGDGDADSNIGGLYHNGRGVAKDDAVAVRWFRKGAAKGSVYAMSDLAACYWTGTGGRKKRARGDQLVETSGRQGRRGGEKKFKDGIGRVRRIRSAAHAKVTTQMWCRFEPFKQTDLRYFTAGNRACCEDREQGRSRGRSERVSR